MSDFEKRSFTEDTPAGVTVSNYSAFDFTQRGERRVSLKIKLADGTIHGFGYSFMFGLKAYSSEGNNPRQMLCFQGSGMIVTVQLGNFERTAIEELIDKLGECQVKAISEFPAGAAAPREPYFKKITCSVQEN